jgi:hypothetical protein
MQMSFDDAKAMLQQHAGHIELPDRDSLVESLRPYRGLSERNFCEIMIGLINVHKELSEQDMVDRELIYACWDLCTRIRFLALSETSPLRTNRLISQTDLDRLGEWYNSIDSFCRRSLHKLDLGTCLSNFIEYIGSEKCPDPTAFQMCVPLFVSLKPDADFELAPLLDRALQVLYGTK